jgi:pimeloyl-ACP methyl ester carboxylesterase
MGKARILLAVLLFIVTAIIIIPSLALGQTADEIAGSWKGVLKVSGVELRIIFNISRKLDNELTATMDSPDQGASGIPMDMVSFEEGHLRLELKAAMASYDGDMSDDGSTIDGEWNQGGMVIPLELARTEAASPVRRPQEPRPPYPYRSVDVAYESTQSGILLAGTLTFPDSGGPFPAVLLISGSGGQDRDETLMLFNHRPFLVLADHLTRQGIAVLRVDDRGIGGSTGGDSDPTSEDFAADVLAGIEFLKGRKEIDPKHTGLAGHSEGGIIAPMVAVNSPDIAFIILMAGTGVTGEEILYAQSDLILKAEGVGEEQIALQRTTQERMFAVLKEEKDDKVAKEKIGKILTESIEQLSEEDKQAVGTDIEGHVETQTESIVSPWMRFFVTYDPKPALTRVTCPVLALIGEKDLQVPPRLNLPAIEEALKEGGNPDYTVKELPGLNHLFQTAETGTISEYGKIEETFSPAALELISSWILERTR